MTETHDLVTRLLAAIELVEQQPGVPLAILRQDLIGQAAARIARWVQPPEAAREAAIRIADAVLPADATHITVDREAVLRGCAADRRLIDIAFEHAAKIDGEWGCVHSAEDIRGGRCPEQRPGELDIIITLAERYDLAEQQDQP